MNTEAVDYEEMLEVVQSVAGNQNLGYQARFRTSDVTQECAVQLIRECKRKDEGSNPNALVTKNWIKKITRNVACKLRRFNSAEKRNVAREDRPESTSIEDKASPGEAVIFREMSASLVLAISQLDKLQRKIIDAHYHQGLSLAETARQLKLNPRYVQRLHQNALENLRQKVAGPHNLSNNPICSSPE